MRYRDRMRCRAERFRGAVVDAGAASADAERGWWACSTSCRALASMTRPFTASRRGQLRTMVVAPTDGNAAAESGGARWPRAGAAVALDARGRQRSDRWAWKLRAREKVAEQK
jgi:hypothetical protein